MSKYKIAIVARWFGGPLPCYFPAWLRSAEMNPDVDFYIFSDNGIDSKAPNIHYIHSTMENENKRAERALGEKVDIQRPYKLIDLKPFVGLIYREYLSEYDFWGYCDIDLAFGHIRGFLTDEVLSKYERFYDLGHFSLFKNNEKMAYINDLPGSIYSRDEILRKDVILCQDEFFGINRICRINNISCYTEPDYAEFWVFYPELLLPRGRKNYPHQVFYWEDGHAYRAGIDESGKIVTDEYVYIHWQDREPVPDENALKRNAYFITTHKLIEKERGGVPDTGCILKIAPGLDAATQKRLKRKYVRYKMVEILKMPWAQKRIWFRQKAMTLLEKKALFSQSQSTI